MSVTPENYKKLRNDASKRVLQEYLRHILHMRQMKKLNRFGLVFGAGIGKSFGFPDWEELLKRLAKQVGAADLEEEARDKTSLAQQLHQKFKTSHLQGKADDSPEFFRLLMSVHADWRKAVHACLYREVPAEIEALEKKDTYLFDLCEIVRDTPLTVTYNFDNTLQRILASKREAKEKNKRGYTTLWSGNVQLNAKQSGVIYHPNGYIPRELRDRPSDNFVFREDSFADQLIDSMAGHYATLNAHFSQTTCLLVGLSLSDPTLKHMLRQHAKSFPGHFHYLIRIKRDSRVRNPEHLNIESATAFDVFNLITLYLKPDEIQALALFLSVDEDDFRQAAEEICGKEALTMRFFVTGPVSVGKSSVVNNFRSLLTQDEWTEERTPGMEKDPAKLLPEEEERIDEWVADQIAKKNNNLLESTKLGVHVVDRAPLDLFAFAKKSDWQKKAVRIGKAVLSDRAQRKLANGHVILLTGRPEVMSARALSLHKTFPVDAMANQQDLLKITYGLVSPAGAVSMVYTGDKSIGQVVKDVAEIVFVKPYVAGDIAGCLEKIEKGGYPNGD